MSQKRHTPFGFPFVARRSFSWPFTLMAPRFSKAKVLLGEKVQNPRAALGLQGPRIPLTQPLDDKTGSATDVWLKGFIPEEHIGTAESYGGPKAPQKKGWRSCVHGQLLDIYIYIYNSPGVPKGKPKCQQGTGPGCTQRTKGRRTLSGSF